MFFATWRVFIYFCLVLPFQAVKAVVIQQRIRVNIKGKTFERLNARSYGVESPRLLPEFSLESESQAA